jgi:NhaP-type Na+/H+ or K+/H+ antiporter
MAHFELTYERITTAIFVGLLFSIFFFSDLVAVIIIVASMAGLALNWLSRQHNSRQKNWQKERQRWEQGKSWW